MLVRCYEILRQSFATPHVKLGIAANNVAACVSRKAEGGIEVEDRTGLKLATSEMEGGPPESLCRGRLQTAVSCVGQEPGW